MNNDTPNNAPGLPSETSEQVLEMIDNLSRAVEGKRADVALTAMTCMIGGALTGTYFTMEQKRAGALYLLSVSAKLAVDLGITGTEIMEALSNNKRENHD